MVLERDVEDLTGRARIRDAALRHFAEHGFAASSLRSIAESAGVTAGLVRHHFGSKQGLREACDAYVFDYMKRAAEERIDLANSDSGEFFASISRSAPPVLSYIMREIAEGGPAGRVVFDRMVQLGESYFAAAVPEIPDADARMASAVLTAMKLGILLLGDQVSRVVGTEILAPENWKRLDHVSRLLFNPELFQPLSGGWSSDGQPLSGGLHPTRQPPAGGWHLDGQEPNK